MMETFDDYFDYCDDLDDDKVDEIAEEPEYENAELSAELFDDVDLWEEW